MLSKTFQAVLDGDFETARQLAEHVRGLQGMPTGLRLPTASGSLWAATTFVRSSGANSCRRRVSLVPTTNLRTQT
jgi:hypothetical protein